MPEVEVQVPATPRLLQGTWEYEAKILENQVKATQDKCDAELGKVKLQIADQITFVKAQEQMHKKEVEVRSVQQHKQVEKVRNEQQGKIT